MCPQNQILRFKLSPNSEFSSTMKWYQILKDIDNHHYISCKHETFHESLKAIMVFLCQITASESHLSWQRNRNMLHVISITSQEFKKTLQNGDVEYVTFNSFINNISRRMYWRCNADICYCCFTNMLRKGIEDVTYGLFMSRAAQNCPITPNLSPSVSI